MKKLLIGILAVVVLVVAAAVIVPFFIPLDAVKEQITTRAEEATGRKLTIAGDFDLSILPRVRIKAGNVTFANAPGAKQANMLELAELEVGVSLFPLISGQVEVSSFVLIDPVINLEVDAQGRPNWQFEEKESSKSSDEKSEKSDGGDSDDGGDSKGLREISLGDVRLVNGTVRFSDVQAGTSQEIQSINAQINLPSLDQALSADGSLAWNGETIDLSLKVDQPRALMEGASTGVETSIKSSPVTLDYKGTVTNAKPAAVAGDISLNVPSIRKLAAWAGKPIEAAGGGLGPLSIKGTLDMAGKSIAFKGAKITIDNMNATGDFEVDTSGSVPSIVASLEVDKLDLNTYLPPESDKPAAPSSGGGAAAPAASAGPSDWSDDPIDFSALKLVNADLSFVTGGIFVKEIKVGRTALKTVLLGGRLSLDLNEMALYDGQGTGRITVDAGRNIITQKLDLKGVQAAPLLTDAAGFDRVEGTANIVADVTTRGASQRQLVSALNGKGSIQFLDGAVRGINLAAMLRNVSSAFLDSSAKETQKTDFAELAGTYTITNGIVKNDDLFLKSPLLRVDGKGTSDMPKRTVNYRVTPKVVASTEGQGGDSGAAGLSVPVQITGPWDNLAFAPDLTGAIDELIKDPSKALEGLKGVIPGTDGTSGSSPLDALKSVIPGSGSSDGSSTTSDNPLGGLKKLFGQ